MNLDPFGAAKKDSFGSPGIAKPGSKDDIFVKPKGGGLGRSSKPVEAEPLDMAPEPVVADPVAEKAKVVLRNPAWDSADVGFNEEADISVEVELPPEHAAKKKVVFELFAKAPGGPERISQAEGMEDGGKARSRIPVYQPQYKEDGLPPKKADYYFTCKHSQSDLLKDDKANKTVDHMADRQIESHILDGLTFAFDSSFLHPAHAPLLKEMCANIKEWRKKNPDGKLAVYGHADAVGKEAYNKGLSERRARSAFSFLVKDPQGWEDLHGEEKWALSPAQALLQSAGEDPGAIDGQDGPKTQAAVKAFQGKHGLAQDGATGPDTRKALYKAFMDANNDLDLKAKDFDSIDGAPTAGCSEFNPLIKTEAADQSNRRVTVLYLKANKNFPIQYPCKKGDIGPCQGQLKKKPGERRRASYGCFFYDDLVKEEKKGGKVAPPSGKLKFLGVKEGEDAKQYVNVKTAAAGNGRERLIEAEVEGGADGTKVFWKVTAAKENSKRSDPKTGVKPDNKGALAEFKSGVAEMETAVKGGKASLVLACGLAGGDSFTVEAGLEKGKAAGTVKVVNWRKLYYQLTYHEDLTPPSMATAMKNLKDVFIEWDAEPPVKHKLMGNGKVIVGNHNAAKFHAFLKSDKTDQCAHIIFCDKQYDGLSVGKNITFSKDADFTTASASMAMGDKSKTQAVPNPPVQEGAKLLLGGTWSNAKTGKSGTLTDDKTKVTDDIGLATWLNEQDWQVDLPKHATPAAASIVKVSMQVTGASGPWGGDGGSAPHNLIVIDTNDTIHSMCVMHELGHIMNMTPLAGSYKAPPGLTLNHKYAYTGMGGSGSHCAFEIDTAKSTATRNVDGKCIMFHQLNRNCKLIYCPECAPFVKAQALEKFQELKG